MQFTLDKTTKVLKLIRKDIEIGYITYDLNQKKVTITDIYVYPGYRKMGYGKILLDYGVNIIKDNQLELESECWFVEKLYN